MKILKKLFSKKQKDFKAIKPKNMKPGQYYYDVDDLDYGEKLKFHHYKKSKTYFEGTSKAYPFKENGFIVFRGVHRFYERLEHGKN